MDGMVLLDPPYIRELSDVDFAMHKAGGILEGRHEMEPKQNAQAAVTLPLTLIPPPHDGDWRVIDLSRINEFTPLAGELRALVPFEVYDDTRMHMGEPQRRVVKMVALVRSSEESAISRLNAELQHARRERTQALDDCRKAERAAETATEKLGEKEKAYGQLEAANRTLANSMEQNRAANRKLEHDIAKVRAAVGEIRMKEILGE